MDNVVVDLHEQMRCAVATCHAAKRRLTDAHHRFALSLRAFASGKTPETVAAHELARDELDAAIRYDQDAARALALTRNEVNMTYRGG